MVRALYQDDCFVGLRRMFSISFFQKIGGFLHCTSGNCQDMFTRVELFSKDTKRAML